MGGGASKAPDDYVLRLEVVKDKKKAGGARRHTTSSDEKKNDGGSSGSDKSTGAMIRGHSHKRGLRNSFDKSPSSSPSNTPREQTIHRAETTPKSSSRKTLGANRDFPPVGAMIRQASGRGASLASPPIGAMIRQQSLGGSSNSPPIGGLIRQASGRGASIAAMGKMSQAGAVKKSDLVASAKFSWLIKAGSFGSAVNAASFETGRVIGMGLMGTVRVGKLKDRNMYCALKSIRKDYIHKHNDQRHIDNERTLMKMLNNPFCIKLFGTFQDGVNVYFAMELAVGGELFRRLNKKGGFGNDTTKFYAHEIFSAVNHVQSLGYVYRDLKPENVMLDEDGHCKLVDFGFSTMPNANGIVKTFCGTPAYLSPEQLDGKFTNGYSKIVDWWSLGILIFELMTGNTPFCSSNSETAYEIYLKIMKVKISFPRSFDGTSKELVQNLCHADLSKRLVDPDIIKHHPYFKMPWDAVDSRKLVPPFVPRIKDESDRDHYFNKYKEVANSTKESSESCRLDLEGF